LKRSIADHEEFSAVFAGEFIEERDEVEEFPVVSNGDGADLFSPGVFLGDPGVDFAPALDVVRFAVGEEGNCFGIVSEGGMKCELGRRAARKLSDQAVGKGEGGRDILVIHDRQLP